VSTYRLDVAELFRQLDARRRWRGLSWRALARELGLSASTLTRLRDGGGAPDADALMTLLVWLGVGSDLAPLIVPRVEQR
jgi:transcriptional regulator with XRE-family HTH domain